MEEEDPVLYILTSIIMLVEGSILWTQKLPTFGKVFLIVLLIVQGLTLIGAWKDSDVLLRVSHVVFGSSLILGSLFVQNKYILFLIASVIVVSQSVRLYQRRCPYHAHIEKLECSLKDYYTGCFPAEAIYGASLAIIVTRHFMGNIK